MATADPREPQRTRRDDREEAALARGEQDRNGRPINSVMATAITACDLAPPKLEGRKP